MSKWTHREVLSRLWCWGKQHARGHDTWKKPHKVLFLDQQAAFFTRYLPQPSTLQDSSALGHHSLRARHCCPQYPRPWAKVGNLEEAPFIKNQLCEPGKAAQPLWTSSVTVLSGRDSGGMRSPQGPPSADQVTQSKAKITEGCPGQVDTHSFSCLPTWSQFYAMPYAPASFPGCPDFSLK